MISSDVAKKGMEQLARSSDVALNGWLLTALLLAAVCYSVEIYTEQLSDYLDETDW